MGAPRLVCSDLDDTFLKVDKSIPAANMDLLAMLAERSIPFVPATGRSFAGIPAEILEHPATRYAICANGTGVFDAASGERIHGIDFDKGLAHELYDEVMRVGAYMDVYRDGGTLACEREFARLYDFGLDPGYPDFLASLRRMSDLDVHEIIDLPGPLDRVTIYWCDRSQFDELSAWLGGREEATWAAGHPRDMEVFSAHAGKDAALGWLCEHEGITLEDALVFGDSPNDVTMLACAGTSIAMANATPDAAAAAGKVSLWTCDEAAVAREATRLL